MADDDAFSMQAARALWKVKGSEGGKNARKSKRKKIAAAVDKRSLRATGRTEQFNFRANSEMKARVHEAADAAGIAVAEWMEQAVEAYLAQQGASDA